MSTIFEKIILREIPAHIVYEDKTVIAFLDISQATFGHTLIVPKQAYQDIYDIPEDVLSHVISVTKKVAIACKEAFKPAGINLLSNSGEVAGQSVFHFHFHVIPRYEAHDVTFKFHNHMNELEPSDYEKRAHLLREALS